MRTMHRTVLIGLLLGCGTFAGAARGDWTTIYGAAREQARQVSSSSLAVPLPPDEWKATVARRREMWREMLGLSPLPPRTPLNATVTGTLDRGDYVVEKVHFQCVPGAYVIGNLYRPAKSTERLPAVLYLCGHSKGKVNAPYQANPRWFGQHGYVALVLDPIQLGESQGFHHGTYREERWDWPSRGYTPAGTEVWNAMRALDYLETRPDVDADRMGVTGLSGGGVISWCLGAADERVKVVVPVCQSGSIEHVVTDRATDGHCDCAFWINYYRWCWPDLGALIAPRSFLIASGSEDVLWRPYGYRDVAHRIRHQYAALGADEHFGLVEDWTPHGYTPKLRRAIFTWFNTHLKNDPTPVTDDVTDFVEPEENLLVFGGKLPEGDKMREIDKLLVARPELPTITDEAAWLAHQKTALKRMREVTFRYTLSGGVPRRRDFRSDGGDKSGNTYSTYVFDSLDGMTVGIKTKRPLGAPWPIPTLVLAVEPAARSTFAGGGSSRPGIPGELATAAVEVRNTAATSVGPGYLWTARRTYPLLGETLPERQVSDLLAAIAVLREEPATGPVAVYGKGYTAPLAVYAAMLDPQITEIVLASPPTSHEDPETPEFLGVLRIGDLPHNLALAYPRVITFVGSIPKAYSWTQQLYEKLGAGDRIRVIRSTRDWRPR
ncbi:MAG: acetylxylan esterase [Planctomycetes bacterium]|nr:acetylxylan esterase [Planctomycetota bacterium]